MNDDNQGHRKRMKERFTQMTEVSELDMLELLLSYGIPRRDTKNIAKALLRQHTTLLNVLTNVDVIQVDFVKDNCKILLKLVHQISVHIAKERVRNMPLINDASELVPVFRTMISTKNIEELYAVFLNINRYVIKYELLSIGTLNSVYAHPREILKKSLNSATAFVVLVHNHPSGNCRPSSADIEFTIALRNLLASVSITLIDHIIVTQNSFLSFAKTGIL